MNAAMNSWSVNSKLNVVNHWW